MITIYFQRDKSKQPFTVGIFLPYLFLICGAILEATFREWLFMISWAMIFLNFLVWFEGLGAMHFILFFLMIIFNKELI